MISERARLSFQPGTILGKVGVMNDRERVAQFMGQNCQEIVFLLLGDACTVLRSQ